MLTTDKQYRIPSRRETKTTTKEVCPDCSRYILKVFFSHFNWLIALKAVMEKEGDNAYISRNCRQGERVQLGIVCSLYTVEKEAVSVWVRFGNYKLVLHVAMMYCL